MIPSYYYDVLNELPNTLNYIASYRKIFRLDEKGGDLAVCNKILNNAFFFIILLFFNDE